MTEINSPGSKRRLDDTDDAPRARKRLVAACFACRTRKIRCNKEKPTCSSCISSKTECVYEPDPDATIIDRASQLILDRLAEISSRLDRLSVPASISRSPLSNKQRNDQHEYAARSEPSDLEEENDDGDLPSWPPAHAGSDEILTWPVLETSYDDQFSINELFDLYTSNNGFSEGSYLIHSRFGEKQMLKDVPMLVNRFIHFVHIKNPMLDIQSLSDDVENVLNVGFVWNQSSCLVLLVCALGALAAPFSQTIQRPSQIDSALSNPGASELELASNFHALAEQRLGLLRSGIVKSQCYVLSAIFHMYMVRPVEAWNDFASASQNLYLYLKSRHRQYGQPESITVGSISTDLQLEQRVYWTCIKSECELREHMALPVLPLHSIRYPYLFPTPPTSSNHDGGTEAVSPEDALTADEDQQSWFYYLTEVALRRIKNRILNSFYSCSSDVWRTMDVEKMLFLTQQFEGQLDEWRASMPDAISFDEAGVPTDEIRFMTRARYLLILTLLYRPFLYHAIHAPDTDTDSVLSCRSYAVKALELCTADADAESAYLHRHHGAWFGCRKQITNALLLIAAKVSGRFNMPAQWQPALSTALRVLEYWQATSPDVVKAKNVIEMLCHRYEISWLDSPDSPQRYRPVA